MKIGYSVYMLSCHDQSLWRILRNHVTVLYVSPGRGRPGEQSATVGPAHSIPGALPTQCTTQVLSWLEIYI